MSQARAATREQQNWRAPWRWRGGAGLVTLVTPTATLRPGPSPCIRALPAPLPSQQPSPLPSQLEWPAAGLTHSAAGACVIGPGLADATAALLSAVLKWAPGPVVLDAAALAPEVLWPALAQDPSTAAADLCAAANGLVLTPHAGEAAKLLETSSAAVNADPLASATRLSRRSGAIVVLKGPTTVSAEQRAKALARAVPGMARAALEKCWPDDWAVDGQRQPARVVGMSNVRRSTPRPLPFPTSPLAVSARFAGERGGQAAILMGPPSRRTRQRSTALYSARYRDAGC